MRKDAKSLKDRNKDILVQDKSKHQKILKLEKNMEALQSLRECNTNLNKANSDLKEQVKQKESEVKGLQEALGVEDEEVQKIVRTSVTMNNETNGHECNACEKSFRQSSDLENHMNANIQKNSVYIVKRLLLMNRN